MYIFSPNTVILSAEVNANFIESQGNAGEIKMYGGSSAPSGWLLCQGQAISRTTYSALYAVIGTIYGVGNGSTTFNVPDLQDKFPIGTSGTKALGSTGGVASKALTVTELPSHTHTQNAHTHTQDAHTHTQDAHFHTGNLTPWPVDGAGKWGWGTWDTGSSHMNGAVNTDATAATNQNATATNQNATATNQNAGSGSAFSIQNPYQAINYIIKT